MNKNKKEVKIGKQIKVTSGKRHAWYEAEIDGQRIELRKPLK